VRFPYLPLEAVRALTGALHYVRTIIGLVMADGVVWTVYAPETNDQRQDADDVLNNGTALRLRFDGCSSSSFSQTRAVGDQRAT
jgi:hypothetical protein